MAGRDQHIKADAGKVRMELIPASALTALGKVLSYGAVKYGDNTWQAVGTDRYVGALLRHLTAYMDDPDSIDAESGLLHIEHVLCNAAFLVHKQERSGNG